MREELKTTGKISSRLRSLALAVGLGTLLFSGDSLAEMPADVDDPFAEMRAVEEDELAAARGGALLPNGMTVEVTGLMRVMVDGQHLSTTTFGNQGQAGGLVPTGIPFADGPASIINSLDGVSLDQYREINFYISNLPTSLKPAPFVPRVEIYQGVGP